MELSSVIRQLNPKCVPFFNSKLIEYYAFFSHPSNPQDVLLEKRSSPHQNTVRDLGWDDGTTTMTGDRSNVFILDFRDFILLQIAPNQENNLIS